MKIISIVVAGIVALVIFACVIHFADDDTKYKIEWENKLTIDPDEGEASHDK